MQIQLSISLLASNRAHSLERCLDSLMPLLSQVPSELIIVFTSRNEQVKEVAQRYTDQIIPFTWRNDFSAARNVGLKAAKGEWFLYIDDDEWFEDVTEIRDFFLSGEYRHYGSAFYIQRNYEKWDGLRYTDFHAYRMSRRIPQLKFKNPIHEELSPGLWPAKYFKAYVHHYGYVSKGKGKDEKTSRNIPLLLESIQKTPDYLKNYLQITKEYYIGGEWEKAEEWCRKGRELCAKQENQGANLWLQAYMGIILVKEPDKHRAVKEIEKILEEKPVEVVRALLYCFLTDTYCKLEEPKKALACAQEFERCLAFLNDRPKLCEEQWFGDITIDVVKDPERLMGVRLNALSCALYLKDREQSERFLKLLPWEEEYRMQAHYQRLDEWKTAYAPEFQTLLAKLPYESPYLLLQKALEKKGETEEAEHAAQTEKEELIVRSMESTEDIYLQHQAVKEAILSGIALGAIAKTMDLSVWQDCVQRIVGYLKPEEIPKLKESAEFLKRKSLLHGLGLEKAALERELTEDYLTGDRLMDALRRYGEGILIYYKEQYREEMFTEEKRELLPRECRFALLLEEALDRIENNRQAEAVRLFREAIQLRPLLTGTIQEAIRVMVRRMNDPGRTAGAEFAALAAQMKGALRGMLAGGQYAQAQAVLNQLMPLMPEDLELIKIRQKLLEALS